LEGCDRKAKACILFSDPTSIEELMPGDITVTLGREEDKREVILHVPPSFDPENPAPLLIVLHGGAQNASAIQQLSGLDVDADLYGFVVAYPNGSGRQDSQQLTWNAGHCCGYSMLQQIDDVGYIKALIDFMVSHYAIDAGRVYLTGISNGGMMAYRAGAELADKVAGIAPIAASLGGEVIEGGRSFMPNDPTSPVSVLAFHGMQDEHVPYNGGIGGPEKAPVALDPRIDISVAESVGFWVENNHCESKPSQEQLMPEKVWIDRYDKCQGNVEVALVTLVDGGHAWPGASFGLAPEHPPSHDVSANIMMLKFFLAHPKQ
jgi:polyhydroxybutyrate depolymerase